MAQSDEFLGSELDGSWTFVDPVGDCSVSVADSMASIVVPAVTEHVTDNTTADNNAPYIYQAIADDDLDVQVKFNSAPRRGNNLRFQGVIAYGDAGTDRVGFIAYSTSNETKLFAFSNVASSGTAHFDLNLAAAAPSHLRLTRAGNTWTCYTSGDGANWTQRTQFSRTMAVGRAGIFAGNSGTEPAFTCRADWWHVGTPSVPTAPDVDRTTVWTDDFTGSDDDPPDVSRWVVDNGPGGSATIQGNELRLRHTDAEGSSGAVYTVDGLSNIGVLVKYRFADVATPPAWLVPGFSAGQTAAVSGGGGGAAEGFGDLYSPDWGYVNELGNENSLSQPFRVDESSIADGTYVYSTYVQLGSAVAASETTFRWCRQERLWDVADARGLLRIRTWADGDPEPETWDLEIWDGLHEGPGRFYLAYGNNAASGPATRDAFVDQVTLYEITADAGEEEALMVATVTDPAEAVQLGLWTLLRNDPELMALGVTDVYDRDPDPRPYPYISIPDPTSSPDSTHDQHGRAVVVRIHTWARGWLRERNERLDNQIGARVIAVLDHQHDDLDAVVDDHTVWMVHHEQTQHVPDPDREIRHRVDRLRIHTSQDVM